ncbi:hypothetical protein UlMin_017632 [Ulmus minor]
MSSNKKKLLKAIFTANHGCGCGKTKLSDVIEPTPKPKLTIHRNPTNLRLPQPPQPPHSSASSSSCDKNSGEDCTSTTISYNVDSISHPNSEIETDPQNSKISSPIPRKKIDECIAVVKDSKDPYRDFKHSMKQMIVEKEIYSKDELQELLHCFLDLNSPSHRDIIVKAFTEIWNDVVPEGLLVSSDHPIEEKAM